MTTALAPAPPWLRAARRIARRPYVMALLAPLALSGTPVVSPLTAAWIALQFAASFASVFSPTSQLLTPTVTRRRAAAGTAQVALTFDDGPHPTFTPRILDLLDRFDARATFFLIGANVAAYPDVAREIVARGHQVANHTMTHPYLLSFNLVYRHEAIRREVRAAADIIERVTGRRTRWFRPPAGFRNHLIGDVVAQEGHLMVTHSIRSGDTRPSSPAEVVDRVLSRVGAGDIVVLHDGIEPGPWADENRDRTVAATEGLLEHLRDRGLAPATLDDLFGLERTS